MCKKHRVHSSFACWVVRDKIVIDGNQAQTLARVLINVKDVKDGSYYYLISIK